MSASIAAAGMAVKMPEKPGLESQMRKIWERARGDLRTTGHKTMAMKATIMSVLWLIFLAIGGIRWVCSYSVVTRTQELGCARSKEHHFEHTRQAC